ncbi:vanadium-dependent haloperoxidase [Glycomyces buryatensis]|uniref:Phosphatase PAP2 family protein n=1 Tax=Glycomyces buryatensis TaxID=2570927 RepID=A0A4S8Q5A0_9ACTN|nr:vanadium-dependent haloperoxidase [Glycomyces buryatensis]THV39467.1 phosphatase PAP2 family protein [Glycomyces buryatensis]
MTENRGRTAFDPVLYWNDTLLETYREVGGAPGPLARSGAMLHAAQWDALVSVSRKGTPYQSQTPELPDDENPPALEAALSYAAYEVLRSVYSGRDYGTALDEAVSRFKGEYTPIQLIRGARIGEAVAEAIVAARASDGANGDDSYESELVPGAWRPTASGAAATPQWGKVAPFTLKHGGQFRPSPPDDCPDYARLLASPLYERQLEEVRALGEKDSRARTRAETRIGFFWANDLDGTYKPPGQLFDATKRLSIEAGLGVEQNVRLFGLLGLALADAGIAAWDSKYLSNIDLWRPEQAIRYADRDGRPDTNPDHGWVPLSQDRKGEPFSPNFPAYVSGHATFGGAWAAVLRLFFDADNVPFTVGTEDPHSGNGETRDFESFTAAAEENARSRVFLGVHYQFDGDAGNKLGARVGEHVFANHLRA